MSDTSKWDTESEEQPTPEYKVKAHLVLEGSEKHDWGVVKDCHGCVNHIPEDAEVVGTWNKYSEGTFWVNLQTSLEALQDRATQLIRELARRRMQEPIPQPKRRTPAPRTAREPSPSAFDLLRVEIKGS